MNRCHRERKIVLLAAEKVTGYTRRWLRTDERGVFELQVRDLLAETSDKAQRLGLTAQQVDDQISTYVALTATEAQLKGKVA